MILCYYAILLLLLMIKANVLLNFCLYYAMMLLCYFVCDILCYDAFVLIPYRLIFRGFKFSRFPLK